METLRFVLAAALKDLRRRLRDPYSLLMWIGIPILIGGLIVLAMGGASGPAPKAVLFVVDRDDSWLSDALVGALSSEQAGIIEARELPEAEARERMDRGEASGLLVIPAGFGDALFEETPVTLELLTNPAQRILPGILEQTLTMLREAVFYAHRVLGDEVRRIADSARSSSVFEELRVAEASVAIRRRMERIGPYLFPPAIKVETALRERPDGARPARSLASTYFPSMLLMALMFMAEGLADDVWRERALGALRRASVGPFGTTPVLAGKLLAGWAAMLLVATVAGLLGVAVFDLDPARVVLAALWASCAGTVLHLLMLLLKLSASSQRGAGLVGNLVLFPLLMVGGSFIPFEVMPAWLARIGAFTPNGWSLVVLNRLVFEPLAPAPLAAGFAGAAACGAALYALCVWRLRAFARA